ncbi:MAG: alpha/beta hydrolase, partial [Gemmatimonadetes bacterium]|nr:alpha/beta hydrolase [Gemmatimonadota bacterium]
MKMVAALTVIALLGVAACAESGEESIRASAAARFAGKLGPCAWPAYEGDVFCGTLDVPEDRETTDGRTIGLHVVVLPAVGEAAPAADALTFLAGGGVAPATRYVPFFTNAVRRLRDGRDIVLVDQRGTGDSNALDCDLPEPHEVEGGQDAGEAYQTAYLDALRVCRTDVGARADPRLYTTANAADDLDAVRAWLGYDQ